MQERIEAPVETLQVNAMFTGVRLRYQDVHAQDTGKRFRAFRSPFSLRLHNYLYEGATVHLFT